MLINIGEYRQMKDSNLHIWLAEIFKVNHFSQLDTFDGFSEDETKRIQKYLVDCFEHTFKDNIKMTKATLGLIDINLITTPIECFTTQPKMVELYWQLIVVKGNVGLFLLQSTPGKPSVECIYKSEFFIDVENDRIVSNVMEEVA